MITDFKTTSRGGELLEITHELQLSAYNYLFRRASPIPEEALEIRNLVKTKQRASKITASSHARRRTISDCSLWKG